jgi:hypothetical protein
MHFSVLKKNVSFVVEESMEKTLGRSAWHGDCLYGQRADI